MDNRAAGIHDGLKHPVIDGDEALDGADSDLSRVSQRSGWREISRSNGALWRGRDAWYRATPEERQHSRLRRAIWWGVTKYLRQGDSVATGLAERTPAWIGN